MTLYTSEVVAQHLDVTERRVRQLRDEGIIREKRPGLYNLVDAMTRYIKYVNAGSKVDLNDERAKLTKVKREAAEMENRVRKADQEPADLSAGFFAATKGRGRGEPSVPAFLRDAGAVSPPSCAPRSRPPSCPAGSRRARHPWQSCGRCGAAGAGSCWWP